jgi:glycogen operon protein
VRVGASVTAEGVNFSVFAKRATGIDLLLFDHVDDAKPARMIGLIR